MKRIHLFGCVLALLLLPAIASAKNTKFMKCGKPLPLQLKPFTRNPQRIDYLCRNSGCHKSAAYDRQNAICAPVNKITSVTLKTFGDLNDASNNEPSISKGAPPASRANLANIISLGDGAKLGEGKTVAFVGFVLEATHSNVDKNEPLTKGNGESVQCNLLGCAFNVIHITLPEDPTETSLCRTVVRPAAWDLFDSPITGQLFFDGSHVAWTSAGQAGFNPVRNAPDFKRLALWEIHPTYAIDVCKNTDRTQCNAADASAWFPFTDLQWRLGLASVTPTEKCPATTDNPKSACPGFSSRRKKHSH